MREAIEVTERREAEGVVIEGDIMGVVEEVVEERDIEVCFELSFST